MEKTMRLCELETFLIKVTPIINGGLHVEIVERDDQLTAVRVTNTSHVSGENNAEMEVHDEWLYTLFVKDNKVTDAVYDSNYRDLFLGALKEIHITSNVFSH